MSTGLRVYIQQWGGSTPQHTRYPASPSAQSRRDNNHPAGSFPSRTPKMVSRARTVGVDAPEHACERGGLRAGVAVEGGPAIIRQAWFALGGGARYLAAINLCLMEPLTGCVTRPLRLAALTASRRLPPGPGRLCPRLARLGTHVASRTAFRTAKKASSGNRRPDWSS